MPEVLKYLGGALRRTYDRVVGKPLPWSMIDKLELLNERAEHDGAVQDGDGVSSGTSQRAAEARDTPPESDTNAKS